MGHPDSAEVFPICQLRTSTKPTATSSGSKTNPSKNPTTFLIPMLSRSKSSQILKPPLNNSAKLSWI